MNSRQRLAHEVPPMEGEAEPMRRMLRFLLGAIGRLLGFVQWLRRSRDAVVSPQPSRDERADEVMLAPLHEAAATAALDARFPQHFLIPHQEFLKLCNRGRIGAHLDIKSSLRELHQLGLVVPLVQVDNASGTEDRVPYESADRWDEMFDKETGRQEFDYYYHPFQVWLVQHVSTWYVVPLRHSPRWLETVAETGTVSRGIRQFANMQRRAIVRFRRRGDLRARRFYEVFPHLVLADELFGPSLRGSFRTGSSRFQCAGRTRRHKTILHPDRVIQLWARWSQLFSRERLAELVGDAKYALAKFAEDTWSQAHFHDPLAKWRDLVCFVRWNEREHLQGPAFAAHRIKELALLAAELVSVIDQVPPERIYDPEGESWTKKRLGDTLSAKRRSQLEFVANRFGLNPNIALLWYVEGKSELSCLKVLDESFESLFDQYGIEIMPIGGVGKIKILTEAIATAKRVGVRVFLLADGADQGAQRHVRKLITEGTLAPDQVAFSDPTFERANFSWDEIGRAMNELLSSYGIGGPPLSGAGLSQARNWERGWCASLTGCGQLASCGIQAKDVRRCPYVLPHLDEARFDLDKVGLAQKLTELFLVPEISGTNQPSSREIVRHVRAVIEAAQRHRVGRPRFAFDKDEGQLAAPSED